MRDLVIYGSGGQARETAQLVDDINASARTWNLLGFLDDDVRKHGQIIAGRPVLGGADWLHSQSNTAVSLGIGQTGPKFRVARRLEGVSFATLIHPRAWLGARVSFGEGCTVCAHVSLTCDIVIGKHAILNVGAKVAHDVVAGDFAIIAPGVNVSGAVRIGDGCDIGTGASIIQGIAIGDWSIVGAGAVVIRDLPANTTAVGNPARVIKTREPGWQLV